MAEQFGSVLYVSSEEFEAATMTEKINMYVNPKPDNLFFAANFEGIDLSIYQFVILDSIKDLGLQVSDFKEMKELYPNTSFILILQQTKAGGYRGGKDWEHTTEIAGTVENGTVTDTVFLAH